MCACIIWHTPRNLLQTVRMIISARYCSNRVRFLQKTGRDYSKYIENIVHTYILNSEYAYPHRSWFYMPLIFKQSHYCTSITEDADVILYGFWVQWTNAGNVLRTGRYWAGAYITFTCHFISTHMSSWNINQLLLSVDNTTTRNRMNCPI